MSKIRSSIIEVLGIFTIDGICSKSWYCEDHGNRIEFQNIEDPQYILLQ